MASSDVAADAKPLPPVKYTDPLDNPEFDPQEFINRLFPTEASLDNVDKVLRSLRMKSRRLETEIRDIVRSQTDAGEQGKRELEEARRAIHELFTKIEHIKTKAEQSEEMVKEITSGIKSLDYAKRHLTTSITTLRRLNMLVAAVDQLEQMTAAKQYNDVAQRLQAVQQLTAYFKAYDKVPKVHDLSQAITRIQASLRRQIQVEFENHLNSKGEVVGNATVLADACSVITVLDVDFRTQIIQNYCDRVLRDYRDAFSGMDAARLDTAHLRYQWLKRCLKDRQPDEKAIFPAEWRVSEAISEKFCQETKRDLTVILQHVENIDVKVLLTAIQKTVEFEAAVANRFATHVEIDESTVEDSPDDTGVAPNSSEYIKNKYKKYIDAKRRAEAAKANPNQKKPTRAVPNAKFFAMVSSAFEPYLSYYIDMEDRNLKELMDKFVATRGETEEGTNVMALEVFSSATDLFYYYRESLGRMIKVSTKKAFVDLTKVFAKYLRSYCDFLQSKLPRDDAKSVSEADIRTACLVINTADYCRETTSQRMRALAVRVQLESKLKEKVDQALVDQVDLSQEAEAFANLAVEANRVLVKHVQNACEPALTVMAKTSWSGMEYNGDQSDYVTQIGMVLKARVPIIRQSCKASKHFREFCTKFAESFAARFSANVTRCRPIGEIGAEQLLLDTHAVKTLLLELHGLGLERSDTANAVSALASYTKFVVKVMGKIEAMLKVLLKPHDPPDGLVEHYILLYADNNIANFQKIIELKGLKKSEMQPLLDSFQRHLPNLPTGAPAVATTAAPSTPTSEFLAASSASAAAASAAGANMLAGFKTTADKNLNKFLSNMSGMKLPNLPVKPIQKPGSGPPGPGSGSAGGAGGAAGAVASS